MKKKYNVNELFVGCPAYDNITLLESFAQYENFGKELHEITINPKRILLYYDGEKYFDVRNGKEMFYVDHKSSFMSNSTPLESGFLSGFPTGPLSSIKEEFFKIKSNQIVFLQRFDEFIFEKFGYLMLEVSQAKALSMIGYCNLFESRPFHLSFEEAEAKEQIRKYVYHIKEEKIKVKKR